MPIKARILPRLTPLGWRPRFLDLEAMFLFILGELAAILFPQLQKEAPEILAERTSPWPSALHPHTRNSIAHTPLILAHAPFILSESPGIQSEIPRGLWVGADAYRRRPNPNLPIRPSAGSRPIEP